MRVEKRDGSIEEVSFDKITTRIVSLCNDIKLKPLTEIDPQLVAQKVSSEIYDSVKTIELDLLSSEIAISLYTLNVEYKELASRIAISNHHKNTKNTFSEKIIDLYNYTKAGEPKPLINTELYNVVTMYRERIDTYIDYYRDYGFDYFGFKTLERSYLLKIDDRIVERPQDMFMRVALAIHIDNIELAFNTYDMMSNRYFIHATPTLFNAGSQLQQFSSCFLLTMESDSVVGIYNTLKDCAQISKYAGGIGLSIHDIRAKNSFIAGTNGKSNGIVPMLRVFNETARYIDQGGGKRNGSFAIYIEPWHSDIFDFLELKKNHGNELERARDLFYGLWIPDLFMECVQKDTDWCLFCPDKCPGLSDTYGSEFERLYRDYESREMYTQKISAQKLWFSILTSQIETGTPYLLYKDSCNRKSNQQNLGTIKSSNLCTEIVEYTSPEESAVCNLASISLPKFVVEPDYTKHKLVIYSKPNCIYCVAAENFCKKHGIEYEKRSHNDITISPEQPVGVTFPKIYTSHNEFIGGFTELEKFFRPSYDFEGLKNTAKTLVVNLNNIIDRNYYPTEKTRRSNIRHRPIGIGVQGLANTFYKLRIGFDSTEARELNNKIFETIYYGSLEQSVEIAKKRQTIIETYKMMISDIKSEIYELEIINYKSKYNILDAEIERTEYLGTYSTYIGSPMYNGKLQFDLWNEVVDDSLNNWTELRKQISDFGIRNSLLVAPMPTASTSQIMGNFECFEPIISNVYTRRVLSGEHMVVNDYLVDDLNLFELWNPEMKDKLIVESGSIQNISEIPTLLKQRYKTAWEIKQKCLIDMSVDRGKFICQSQSLNLFMEAPNFSKLSSMHFYGWKCGLKTGMYYLRTRPSSKAIQFTVSPEVCESCSA